MIFVEIINEEIKQNDKTIWPHSNTAIPDLQKMLFRARVRHIKILLVLLLTKYVLFNLSIGNKETLTVNYDNSFRFEKMTIFSTLFEIQLVFIV